MEQYDPNDVGLKNGHIFSLPHTYESAEIILLPVPWDATVSYNDGTSNGPEAILEASSQLDFYHPSGAKIWEYGVHMLPVNEHWKKTNLETRALAKTHIEALENESLKIESSPSVLQVNTQCAVLKNWVKEQATAILDEGKLLGLLGGDHSCPLGFIEALNDRYSSFGILQFDAHADLRETYENFTYSHASIFYNALQFSNLKNLTQVSIRDVSPNEVDLIKQDKRLNTYYDWNIKRALFNGETWDNLCQTMIKDLPQNVYLSFDIDGLNPSLCPNTGTPVPGGLSFEEAIHLIGAVVQSGRKIIGFDLCEVGIDKNEKNPSDWDANVGARVLFNLCTALHNSNH